MIGSQSYADSSELAASSSVFALLRTAAGDNLTSTTVGGSEGLDVNILNAIEVSIKGVYDVALNPTPDNVGLIVHARSATPGDADQTFRSTGGVPSADGIVSANVHALDVAGFGMLFNGTTWDRAKGTSGAAHVHIASQAAPIGTRQSYNAPLLSLATVGVIAAAVLVTQQTGRGKIILQNQGSKPIYIGNDATVTVRGGVKPGVEVAPNGFYEEMLDASVSLFAISSGAGQKVAVMEYVAA